MYQINGMLDLNMYWNLDRCGEDVFLCFHDLVHLFLLCIGFLCGGGECCCDFLFTFKTNHEEYEFPFLGDYVPALFRYDERYYSGRKCL